MKSITLFVLLATARTLLAQQTAIDLYVKQGLESNLVLRQKQIGYEKATLALKVANSYFVPKLGLQGSYTSGSGGRNISIPVGDLLNPVYRTLNQLTASDNFPQIDNVSQNFFPRNLYDVRVRTEMPLLNTDLIYSKKISEQQIVLQQFEVDAYARELVKTIKTAYYNYASATEAVKIYASARQRAEEGKRVAEVLLKNGKGLPAYVLRAESELLQVQAQHADAQRQVDNAQRYFNFLLNRAADESINISPIATKLTNPLLQAADSAGQQREELKSLRQAQELNETVVKMNRLFWVPRINGFADLGSQSEQWKFDSQSRYYLFGFQLDVPLFAGMRNRTKTAQAALDLKSTTLNYQHVQRLLHVSAVNTHNQWQSAYQTWQWSAQQQVAAESYQRLIEKGYREGVNSFIETVDARNQLTQSQLLAVLNYYKVLQAEAAYEREAGSYHLSLSNN